MANEKMMETLEKLLNKMDEKDKAHQEALVARDEAHQEALAARDELFAKQNDQLVISSKDGSAGSWSNCSW